MAEQLYTLICEHGQRTEFRTAPEGSWFTSPLCTFANGAPRDHHVTRDKYRVATEEDFYTPKIRRHTRSDKGVKRGPRKSKSVEIAGQLSIEDV